MAKKTPEQRKQELIAKRIKTLIAEGFLPREARYYAQFPISSGGMRSLRRLRASTIKAIKAKGYNPDRYIIDSYRALGYLDNRGRINPELRNRAISDQFVKPIKERDYSKVTIPIDQYPTYLTVWETGKISPGSAMKIASVVPFAELPSRLAMYRRLRRNRFSDNEAIQIITATVTNKKGEKKLQNLDLDNPGWQQHMKERIRWYNDMVKQGKDRGWTPRKIISWIQSEISKYLAKGGKPWDWLKFFSPGSKNKPKIDFYTGLRSRAQRLSQKKMPYKVAR